MEGTPSTAAPSAGFGAVIEVKMIATDIMEVDRLVRALVADGYSLRFRNAMQKPHDDGVFIGEYTFVRDLPQPQAAAEGSPSSKKAARRQTKKKSKKKR